MRKSSNYIHRVHQTEQMAVYDSQSCIPKSGNGWTGRDQPITTCSLSGKTVR